VAAAWAGGERDDVHLELDPALPLAVTDAERLRTALLNILANARHAVESVPVSARDGAGTGREEPAAVAVAATAPVVVRTRRNADRIIITIQDQGTGIAANDMAHIFDPYFTTRRAGTGLGLPIARNIIEGLGGAIHVRSQRNRGTEISIELPLRALGAGE
jgi:signal transduction histidine kinase